MVDLAKESEHEHSEEPRAEAAEPKDDDGGQREGAGGKKGEDGEKSLEVDEQRNQENAQDDGVRGEASAERAGGEDDDKYKIYSDGIPADPIKLTDPGFIDIARVEAGGSFGALSLVDGKMRMATAKTLTRCHCLVLNAKDWACTEKDIKKRKI